jgi:transposase
VRGTLDRIAPKIDKSDFELLERVLSTFVFLTKLIRAQKATTARLRRLFGLKQDERTAAVVNDGGQPEQEGEHREEAAASKPTASDKPKQPGHGRRAASEYSDAEHIKVLHKTLQAGARCTHCPGTLYGLEPSTVLRVFGQPNLVAKCWDCERLRCSGCGHVFTAQAPEDAQGPKYDETAISTIIHLRFGAGLPHHRLERIQGQQNTPVPASTQWELIDGAARVFLPIFKLLETLAAQGTIIHNDDTYARILQFMGKSRAQLLKSGQLPDPDRTGLFTTAVVSKTADGPICLFYTGRKHAGENLANLLVARAADLDTPILMSDALSRNVPDQQPVEEANCLAHARRNFIDEFGNHPAECKHVLEKLQMVFLIEKQCAGKTSAQRLHEHRTRSGPIMEELRAWMNEKLKTKAIEPNSGLGKAFNYMLKRWRKFTMFTRKEGAPLENNIAERALKRSILHRRNSMFFRTQHGALLGDIFTSLIHTAEIHGVNPWHYLTAVQKNATDARANPEQWLPWSYRKEPADRA